MKKHRDVLGGEAYSNEQLAHFLVRLLFALFAEDMGLLPEELFTQIVRFARWQLRRFGACSARTVRQNARWRHLWPVVHPPF